MLLLLDKKLTSTAFQASHASSSELTFDTLLLLPSITVDRIYCLVNIVLFLNQFNLITSSF